MKTLTGFCGLVSALVLVLGLSEQTESQWTPLTPQATDCTHIKALSPSASSGLYFVQPPGAWSPFQVYCEMRPDGGWTVFQRRSGGAVSFNRNWAAYKNGFGNLNADHWLGLSKVHSLTKDQTRRWTLRVDLWDYEEGTAYAEYSDFRLDSQTEAYKLHVGTFRGDADAIRGAYAGIDQNGSGFSTFDRDNDGCSPCIFGDIAVAACSRTEGGGWWFSRCGSANLHGDWHPAGDNIGWASGLHWDTWKGAAPYSARATRMMIRSA
ncbi:angiopoietin-4-like isoform X2 [Lampris incognitus]|uniref:angiopoietin-4-like isoform X2 n=1 Tax=Lampris incognitus TaxID=2546036 RepID=UPI0024B530B0|nr:angiopoietin-4-like isoform X2 [Lampris incognitus]